MAKTRLRPRVRHKAGYQMKGVKVYVALRRDVSLTGKPRFFACAALKWHRPMHGFMPHAGPGFVCRPGRNPRRAMATALVAFARNVAGRRGAFAGFGSPKGRKHRGWKRYGRRVR